MSVYNKQTKNDTSLLETIKSKYVLANTVKTNKLSSKLSKSVNCVTSDKSFIGYNDDDYENVEKMCNLDNINLFVKNKAHFSDCITCDKNLNIKMQTTIGYHENEIDTLNNNTTLHIKGNTEINGNLNVNQNINSEQCINIGFENEVPANTSKLNVNGNSEFVGDNIIYGSEYVKNNLIVNDKATFYNDVFLGNSVTLKKESINDIIIINNMISMENYKVLLNNILSSIQEHSQDESSALKFYSKKNNNMYSGLLSASKKFLLSKKKTVAFILVYAVYSNSRIICVKPVLDTFIIIDSKENLIKIGNIPFQQLEVIQSKDTIQLTKKNKEQVKEPVKEPVKEQVKEINNDNSSNSNNIVEKNTTQSGSVIGSAINLLKNNKITNFFKKKSDNSDDDLST
jgi:hypothetical protein